MKRSPKRMANCALAMRASQLLWWTIFAESSLEPQPRQPERSRRFWFLVREKQARGTRLAADVDEAPHLRCGEVHQRGIPPAPLGLGLPERLHLFLHLQHELAPKGLAKLELPRHRHGVLFSGSSLGPVVLISYPSLTAKLPPCHDGVRVPHLGGDRSRGGERFLRLAS